MIIDDIILVVSVVAVAVLGFFVIGKFDVFIDKTEKKDTDGENKKTASPFVLSTRMTDEQIISSIREYEEKFGTAEITVCKTDNTIM